MSETTLASAMDVAAQEGSKLGWPDIVVIILYFVCVLGVGLWSSYRSGKSVTGYFLASRNMHWIPVGASLFASNIGSGHFIGLAGSGAATGIGVAGYEQSAVFILLLLGWVFVPVYMSSGVYTMPEYLRERFGGQRIRVYLSFLALLLYIFTKISADLYAGALFIQLALNKYSTGWLYISILVLLGIAALFTIAGGLSAVIWTDFVQTVLMIIGSFILMIMSFIAVGGYSEIVRKYPTAISNTTAIGESGQVCGMPPDDYMNLFRSSVPGKSDLPWTGMTLGLAINSIWYWCTDQVIVQRALAAKNLTHAKAGTILASYLKFLPLWLLVLPGMAARILYPDRVGCSDPDQCEMICGSRGGCTNIAFAELVLRLLPTGLSGLMLAVMLAALMSSLTSIFNSASTIFTIDVWTRFRKSPTDRELLLVGRVFVVVLVVISVIWIPVIQNSSGSQLFVYIQSVSSFLAPPICAVFLLGFFWKRTTEPGAFWGLMGGLVVGMIRFIVEFSFLPPACGDDPVKTPSGFKEVIGNVHFLNFGIILFLITLAISVTVSFLTKPIPEECMHRLTWWTRYNTQVRKNIDEVMDGDVPVSSTTNDVPSDKGSLPKNGTVNTAFEDESGKKVEEMRIEGEVEGGDNERSLSPEEKALNAANSIKESPTMSNIVLIQAVICLCLTCFIYGYFA